MHILLIAGARPNFMKIAPIARRLNAAKFKDYAIVHTGQHYDNDMSQVFFDELEISRPDYFLNAGSGSHAAQTAKIMVEFEKVCDQQRPSIVVVVGDVNSTLACTIVAKKMCIKVAHIEAGLRSGDMSMPEEINRIVTDSISDYLFASERSAVANLKAEGKADGQIFFVGNVMIDTLYHQMGKLNCKGLVNNTPYRKPYGVVTLHRPSNVDNKETCTGIVDALIEISKHHELIFPAHPRTMKSLSAFGLLQSVNSSNIRILSPLPYMEFLCLWKDANIVITDSGGIQEETTALGIPCFTIRENTERPITVEEGSNVLVGTTKDKIIKAFYTFKSGITKSGKVPELWDGKTAHRIVDILTK